VNVARTNELVLLAVAVALAGCNINLDGPDLDGLGDFEDFAAGRTIDSDGGKIQTPSGASVEVPRGALSGDVEIGVAAVQEDEIAATEEEGIRFAGTLVAFTPHGTRFDRPVRVELPFEGNANAVLRLADEDDVTWEVIQGATFADQLAVMHLTQFSILVPVEAEERALADLDQVPGCGDLRSDRGRLEWASPGRRHRCRGWYGRWRRGWCSRRPRYCRRTTRGAPAISAARARYRRDAHSGARARAPARDGA